MLDFYSKKKKKKAIILYFDPDSYKIIVKITVETIKHLSKNTNFIQTIDPVTGDVTPSKLLKVRKEESYDTYLLKR